MIDLELRGKDLSIEIDATVAQLLDIDMAVNAPQHTIVHINTTAYWNSKEHFVGERGHIYVYTDHSMVDGSYIPAIKIGDGLSYLIDNPFVSSNQEQLLDHILNTGIHITQAERYFWNQKVRCDETTLIGENLKFTKN